MPSSKQASLPFPIHYEKPPLWLRFMAWILKPWIVISREPVVPPFQVDRPVCYVLENYGLTNLLILDRACREAGLPSPMSSLPGNPLGRKRSYLALSRRGGNARISAPKNKSHSDALSRLIMAHRLYPNQDVQLVPVSIFVGRAPNKQSGWFSVLFSENWVMVGRFRRIFSILLNGRDTLVRFSASFPVRDILAEASPHEKLVRKAQRLLRAHLRKVRAAVIGPDLSTRRLLVDRVLDAEPVRKAIAEQARRDKISYIKAWEKAHQCAWEIAADYSHPLVRSVSFALSGIWNRIYEGVIVHHMDSLKEIAPGHEVVYVPCHRSHMDYLLLSYLLYTKGMVPPHIAAGVNLNLPVIGPVLRKGGAFFLRRSFKSNALYSIVFSEYVAQLVAGGYSLEYFIEGGRSRTGRMLAPKGGMISMTVKAYMSAPRRSVVFQPIYIGYERLIEGKSYLDELSGRPKEKETIWALMKAAIEVLREHYGKVTVNFGEPIYLDDSLAKHAPNWREERDNTEGKLPWLSTLVEDLAEQINVNINRAADVNPINLLAIALLSTPKHAMDENDLIAQIELSKRILKCEPYGPRVTVTEMSAQSIITYGEEMGVVCRAKHTLGDVLSMQGETAVLQSYFRNNVLHLFSAAAWISLCFQNNRRLSRNGLVHLGLNVYPFMKSELFLPWSDAEFAERLNKTIDLFIREGILSASSEDSEMLYRASGQTDEVFQLRTIAHSMQQAFERYFIAITTLVKNGSGNLSASALESLCHLTAQRLSLLYAPAAPEFFDKSLFRGFIANLRSQNLIWVNEHGKLDFDQGLNAWEQDARLVLNRELRHTIHKISPDAVNQVTEAKPSGV